MRATVAPLPGSNPFQRSNLMMGIGLGPSGRPEGTARPPLLLLHSHRKILVAQRGRGRSGRRAVRNGRRLPCGALAGGEGWRGAAAQRGRGATGRPLVHLPHCVAHHVRPALGNLRASKGRVRSPTIIHGGIEPCAATLLDAGSGTTRRLQEPGSSLLQCLRTHGWDCRVGRLQTPEQPGTGIYSPVRMMCSWGTNTPRKANSTRRRCVGSRRVEIPAAFLQRLQSYLLRI